MKLPDPVDGIALSSDVRRPRKTLYFEKTMTVAAPNFPQRASSVHRQSALFGTQKLDQLPAAVSGYPEWRGRPITDFVVDERTIPVEIFDLHNRERERDAVFRTELVPCLISGSVMAEDLPQVPAQIVLVVEGIIRDTGKTFWIQDREYGFEFLLPESVINGPSGSFELYVIDSTKSELRLRPLKIMTTAKTH